MAAPEITEYSGDIPLRTGQDQATFSNNVGTLLTFIPPFVIEMNASTAWVNEQAIIIDAKAKQASDSADSSALSAEYSASSANMVGDWSDQTGQATKPYSVAHIGTTWLLLNNLADVTGSEPGQTSVWFNADTTRRMTQNRFLHFYRNN